MNSGKYIFSQMTAYLPKRYFERLAAGSDDRTENWGLSHWAHLLVLIFGQLAGCRSLRELADILVAHGGKSYHLGFGKDTVNRSALSRVNKNRDPYIFEAMAFHMISLAEEHGIPREFVLRGKYYAFDSTTIDLCLSLFDWASFRETKSGIKVHFMFDIILQIPKFFRITNAKVNDMNGMDVIPYEQGACYIFDRGYFDLSRLFLINTIGAYFVIREKGRPKFEFEVGEDLLDLGDNVITDQVIRFSTSRNKKNYPAEIRRILYYVPELRRTFVYYTNNFYISAKNIALLYKNRWQVETFHKWMKQHLRIKNFWGYSQNAVRIQICAAITTFCLVHIIRHSLGVRKSTYEVMRILGNSLLVKDDMRSLFFHIDDDENDTSDSQPSIDFED